MRRAALYHWPANRMPWETIRFLRSKENNQTIYVCVRVFGYLCLYAGYMHIRFYVYGRSARLYAYIAAARVMACDVLQLIWTCIRIHVWSSVRWFVYRYFFCAVSRFVCFFFYNKMFLTFRCVRWWQKVLYMHMPRIFNKNTYADGFVGVKVYSLQRFETS